MEARTLIRNVRSLNGLTRAELAKIANISPSTISRIERGELDPSWSSMMSILQSVGYSIGDRIRPYGDVSAVEAARRAIERDIGSGDSSSVASWLDRWLRAGLVDRRGVVPGKVGQIALLAGNAAAVVRDQGFAILRIPKAGRRRRKISIQKESSSPLLELMPLWVECRMVALIGL